MKDDEVVNVKICSRLFRLEAVVEERKEALKLARDIADKDLQLARQQIDHRLEGHNEWQKRWDKREAILATKEDVNSAVRVLLGIILAVVTILGLLIRLK